LSWDEFRKRAKVGIHVTSHVLTDHGIFLRCSGCGGWPGSQFSSAHQRREKGRVVVGGWYCGSCLSRFPSPDIEASCTITHHLEQEAMEILSIAQMMTDGTLPKGCKPLVYRWLVLQGWSWRVARSKLSLWNDGDPIEEEVAKELSSFLTTEARHVIEFALVGDIGDPKTFAELLSP
jgi:hypothetical protein